MGQQVVVRIAAPSHIKVNPQGCSPILGTSHWDFEWFVLKNGTIVVLDFGDKLLGIRVVCAQNGTKVVLKTLTPRTVVLVSLLIFVPPVPSTRCCICPASPTSSLLFATKIPGGSHTPGTSPPFLLHVRCLPLSALLREEL